MAYLLGKGIHPLVPRRSWVPLFYHRSNRRATLPPNILSSTDGQRRSAHLRRKRMCLSTRLLGAPSGSCSRTSGVISLLAFVPFRMPLAPALQHSSDNGGWSTQLQGRFYVLSRDAHNQKVSQMAQNTASFFTNFYTSFPCARRGLLYRYNDWDSTG